MTTPTPPPVPHAGRPRSLDDAKRREICALVSAGCSIADAARYVRCALSTIHRERRGNPEFREKLRQAGVESNLRPLEALRQAVGTHWRAAAWMLERTQPAQFSRSKPPVFGQQEIRVLTAALHQFVEDERLPSYQANRLKKRISETLNRVLAPLYLSGRTRRGSASSDKSKSLRDHIEFPTSQRPFTPPANPPIPSDPSTSIQNVKFTPPQTK